MSIVNFSITKPLEKKVNWAIKTQGFASKAEFFRFAIIEYLQFLESKKYIYDFPHRRGGE